MLQFVLQKIRNKKWLILSLLVGNLLLVAICAAGPMYTKAALQRTLTRTMSDYAQQENRYPSSVSIDASSKGGMELLESDEKLVDTLGEKLGAEPLAVVCHRFIDQIDFFPELSRGAGETAKSARVGFLRELEDHIKVVSGSVYQEEPDEKGVLDALISEKCMVDLGVMVGETLTAQKLEAPDGAPLRVRIAGIFRAKEEDTPYWYRGPASYGSTLFLSEKAFASGISLESRERREQANWCWIFDYRKITVDNCEAFVRDSAALAESFQEEKNHSYQDHFTGLIESYQVQAAQVRGTLWILQAPIYVLLAAFLFMVSRQMLELEAAEIAVLKSRGASQRQIIGIYCLQSALLAAVSLILGVPLSFLVCRIIGSANAFLEFVSRSSLRLELTAEVLLYALAAAVLSMAAMVLPVLRYSKTTIVAVKQGKAKKRSAPLWQRLFLDVILMGVGLYGFFSFQGQKEHIAERVQSGAGLDPLIYLSSSLFIIGCGLLALRVIPLIARLVYRIGRRWWPPSLYASYLWVLRSKGGGYIVTFLVITIALGIFNASTARTVNSNETSRITYQDGGADLVLMERWGSNTLQVESDDTGGTNLLYFEPDYEKYKSIPGVASMTRVLYDDDISLSLDGLGRGATVTLMGIHTREFGETASLKKGLLPEHFYDYLNAISQKSDGVLVSSLFRDKYHYNLGDTIIYRNANEESARGVIYGFVDYWPTYLKEKTAKNSDGTLRKEENLLIVANLSYLQAQWGVTPYQVWMRMEGGDTSPVYDFIEEQGLVLTEFRDQTADLVAMKNDPGIQGTNGILTVGFVVALVLCTVGFLLYWILAIRNRALQFGIFRAMGMSMKEIVVMLLNEQLYISGLSIAIGTGVGLLTSRLFVPLIQLAYVKSEMPLPLEVLSAGSDVLRLLMVVLLVMAACMMILGTIIRRLKIAQALKLGED